MRAGDKLKRGKERLLHSHEDLNLILSTYIKAGCGHADCHPSAGMGGRREDFWGLLVSQPGWKMLHPVFRGRHKDRGRHRRAPDDSSGLL